MKVNLKVLKGHVIYTFLEDGKVLGYLGYFQASNLWEKLGIKELK